MLIQVFPSCHAFIVSANEGGKDLASWADKTSNASKKLNTSSIGCLQDDNLF